MKKFLKTNILLSLGAILLANIAVDSPTRSERKIFKTITSAPVITLAQTKRMNSVVSKVITLEKFDKDLERTIEQSIVTNKRPTVVHEIVLENQPSMISKKLTPIVKIIIPKIKELKKKRISKNLTTQMELSYTDLNEQKRIVLKSIPTISYSGIKLNFSDYPTKSKIAKIIKISDRISTASAATEKSNDNPKNRKTNLLKDIELMNSKMEVSESKTLTKTKKLETAKVQVEKVDDLIFYDLEEEVENKVVESEVMKKIITKKLSKSKTFIGKTIVTSHQSEKKKNLITNKKTEFFTNKPVPPPYIAKTDEQIVTNSFTTKSKPTEQKNYECMQDSDLSINETFNSNYELTLTEIDYSKKKSSIVRNFEMRFHDDINEMKSDFNEGVLRFEYKMNGQMSLRRGTIFSKGYYPTTIDIMYEAGDLAANVPVFTLESFNSILSDENIQGGGSHLLIELDDKTEDVEIDESKNYIAKLYLDNNFRTVLRDDSDYQYILFVGVEAGNSIVKFKRDDNKVVTKLLYLANDEIYYEPNFYGTFKNDSFSLYKEGLLSKCKSILNVGADNIKTWSHDSYIKKDSLNRITIPKMIYPLGSRKYYEIKYDEVKENIFIGRWSQEAVVVPTEQYIRHIISQFDGSLSNNQCIIQMNLAKPIKEIAFNGESKSNNMNMQINILDGDGKFYQDFSEQSKRVFLMGEEEGMISIRIDYADNSTQFLQSYCSESTYIVEQL